MASVLEGLPARPAPDGEGRGPAPITRVRRRRWALVAGLLALLLAVPAAVSAWPVSPAGDLAPAELRDRVVASAPIAWSGYAEAGGGLNLPNVAQFSDVTSLLSGTTRMRAWYLDEERQRVDQLYPTGERSRYTNPDGQAVWDYGASLLTLVESDPIVRLPRPDDLLPPQLARLLLSGTAPDDAVSALPARRVAGVDAAGFRVTVADPRTTVGALDVWAEPRSGLPVAVEVVTKGADGVVAGNPVVVSRFLELDADAPDADLLEPRRGPGSGVTRSPSSDLFGVLGQGGASAVPTTVDGVERETPEPDFPAIGQYGTSLAQLIVVPLPPEIASSLVANIGNAGAAGRTISVQSPESANGRVANASAAALESPLLSLAVVRAGDQAWVVAGLVPDDVLDAAAADVVRSSA